MGKFNKTKTRPAIGRGPIVAETLPSTTTYEGAPGHLRDAKSALFLLAVANFVAEDSFYEKAGERDDRFARLVATVAVEDLDWFTALVRWLRAEGNLRSAPLVAAAEGVRARLAAGAHGGNRQLVDVALLRADEPGELIAYWRGRYGRALPSPLKNGVADAVRRLYTEWSLLRYDTDSRGYRFADVVETVRPQPVDERQSALFRHALDRRHHHDDTVPGELGIVRRNAALRSRVAGGALEALTDAEELRRAGMTWEDVLSLAGTRIDKAVLWEALVPSMGIMALARNLRNFDEAGVSDAVAAGVTKRFTDPDEVARSRMFPFRWLAAYERAPSLRWGHALDTALRLSLRHVPAMPGRSLVLVDTSSSMSSGGFSKRSTMSPMKAAAVFGVALAAKGERVDLHGFADGVFRHPVGEGASVIREVDRFCGRVGEVGHGTRIVEAIRATYDRHDRVFVISDMQTFAGHGGASVTGSVPAHVPLYGFNLGGYRAAAYDAGAPNRIEFGGLTDATFRMIPLLEAGRNARWPWETADD